jgi:type IV secretion system protein TrbL
MKKIAIIIVFFTSWFVVAAAQADTGGADVGDIVSIYQQASKQFQESISTTANWLFGSLIGLSIVFSIGKILQKDANPYVILAWLVVSCLTWGFQMKLMNSDWLQRGIDGFIQIGKNSTGMTGLNMGDILWQGFDLVSMMFTKYSAGSWLSILSNPFSALVMAACTIMVIISFLILTAQVAITSAQMYFYLAVAPLLIAFGGLKATNDIATKAISSVVSYGLRFLAIYFVVFVAQKATPMMGDMLALANNMPDNTLDPYGFKPLLSVVAFSAVLAWLAMQAPKFADGVLQGVSSMSAGDAVGPGVAAAAGAAGGAVAGGISSAASAAGKAANDGFTPLREAVAAATSGSSPSSTSGFSPDAGTGDGENNNGSGFSSRDLTPSWMKVENSASTATMGGDSAGTNSGTNRTGFNSGASTNAENSGSNQSNNNAQTRQNQDANRAGSGAVSGGSPGPAETVANGESSGVSGEKGSELNSAASTSSALSGESLNATSGQAGTDFNSGPAPESGAIEGVSSSVDAASIGSGSGFQAEGGSIGGANINQPAQSTSSKVADGIQQGLQDFAQHEKSSGASVNIQFGHDDI